MNAFTYIIRDMKILSKNIVPEEINYDIIALDWTKIWKRNTYTYSETILSGNDWASKEW